MYDTPYPTVTAEQFEAAYEQAATALAAYVAARDRARLAEQIWAEVRLRNATARAADLRPDGNARRRISMPCDATSRLRRPAAAYRDSDTPATTSLRPGCG